MLKKYFLPLFIIVGLASCNMDSSGSSDFDFNKADWLSEANFKFDFNDKSAKIKTVKGDTKLIAYILEGVESGKIPAYDYETEKALSAKQIQQIFHPIDTIITYDLDTGFESGEKAVKNDLNLGAITRFRLKQEWAFDEENFKLYNKNIALAILETKFNDDNSIRGDLPLFWVKF